MTSTSIRFRVDFSGLCSIGFGKIALLEGIARTGSLSQAAREMEMSYRRAWLLVDSMNTGFDTPVITASVGGSGGGGATLTDFGRQVVSAFRDLEPKLLTLTQKHMREIAPHAAKDRPKRAKSARPGQRRSLARNKSAQAAN
jgi:molybdate transport system regulatory protein